MSIQDIFSIVVVIFTVSNIGAMGLELNQRETLKYLRSICVIGLIDYEFLPYWKNRIFTEF